MSPETHIPSESRGQPTPPNAGIAQIVEGQLELDINDAEASVESREVLDSQVAVSGLHTVLGNAREATEKGGKTINDVLHAVGKAGRRTFTRLVGRAHTRKNDRTESRIEKLERRLAFQRYLGELATARLSGLALPEAVAPQDAREKRSLLDLEDNLYRRGVAAITEKRANAIFGQRRGTVNKRATKRARRDLISETHSAYESGKISATDAASQIRNIEGVLVHSENGRQRRLRRKTNIATTRVVRRAGQPIRNKIHGWRLARARGGLEQLSRPSSEAEKLVENQVFGPAEPNVDKNQLVLTPADQAPEPSRPIPRKVHVKGTLFGGPDKPKFYEAKEIEQIRTANRLRQQEIDRRRDLLKRAGVSEDEIAPLRGASRRPDLRVVPNSGAERSSGELETSPALSPWEAALRYTAGIRERHGNNVSMSIDSIITELEKSGVDQDIAEAVYRRMQQAGVVDTEYTNGIGFKVKMTKDEILALLEQ